MYKRKCSTCGNDITTDNRFATIIRCEECKDKLGLSKRDYDSDEFVYCRICNATKRRLDFHIKAEHKMTVDEYSNEYPDAPIFSKNTIESRKKDDCCRQKMSRAAKASWKNEKVKKVRIKAIRANPSMKGKTFSEEHRQKIAKSVSETKQQFRYLTLERRKNKKLLNKLKLKQYIICPLCLEETGDEITSRLRLITLSHIKCHNYTYEMLFEKYPDCILSVEEIGKRHSKSISGDKHFNYGKHLDEDVKSNISNGIKRHFLNIPKKYCVKCGKKISIKSKYDNCKQCRRIIYGADDAYDKVFCRECNLMKSDLSEHIKNVHNMTLLDYKSKHNVMVVSSQKIIDNISNGRIGLKLSDEQRLKFKQDMIKKEEQKNIDKSQWENDFRICNYNIVENKTLIDTNDIIYCRYCLLQFKRITQHIESHNLTAFMYKQLFPGAPLISKNLIKSIMFKVVNSSTTTNYNFGYGGIRNDIGHYVRSMVEANFCRILKLNNIRYKYEPERFSLNHDEYVMYVPDILLLDDFYLWQKKSFIELKKRINDEDVKKVNVFLDQYKECIVHSCSRES
jgi:hypothetical protein